MMRLRCGAGDDVDDCDPTGSDSDFDTDSDLGADVKLWVVADRALDVDAEPEMEFDSEGELIEKPAKKGKKAEAAAAAE